MLKNNQSDTSVQKLSAFEAESLISGLAALSIDTVGSEKWTNQHQNLEKLNIQVISFIKNGHVFTYHKAHLNIQGQRDEFVTTSLVSENKIGVLIHELLVIEVWQGRVFPHVLNDVSSEISTQLFHEATLVNFLEVAMTDKNAVLSADEAMIELIDYCSRKIAYLCN
ncbi:Zinc finger MYND domain-containing protein 10, partial [Nowakowskiella sp. JEL0078]